MTIEQAIRILAAAHGSYQGTRAVEYTGNLIEDIMNEGDIGETFHWFGERTRIREHDLIPLAKWKLAEANP